MPLVVALALTLLTAPPLGAPRDAEGPLEPAPATEGAASTEAGPSTRSEDASDPQRSTDARLSETRGDAAPRGEDRRTSAEVDPEAADPEAADDLAAGSRRRDARGPRPALEPPPRDGDPRRFVFAALGGVGWAAVSPIPSGEATLFFGSTLRPRLDRRGRRWRAAIGYEPTLSVGAADYFSAFLSFGGGYGRVYHRHHVSVLGYGARNGRLHYAVGGGPLLWSTTLTGFEVEGRIGAILHGRRDRIHGLVGARARLVMILGGYPIPQLGLFAGVALW